MDWTALPDQAMHVMFDFLVDDYEFGNYMQLSATSRHVSLFVLIRAEELHAVMYFCRNCSWTDGPPSQAFRRHNCFFCQRPMLNGVQRQLWSVGSRRRFVLQLFLAMNNFSLGR